MTETGVQLPRPLVSVAVTTYNVAPFLEEALTGVAAQSYDPLEVVAYDDGSTDDSRALLERSRGAQLAPITILAGEDNVGHMEALKRALASCRGKYVAVLDGDDVWMPGKLEAQVAWLEADPARVLCAHDVECFESDTGRILWTVAGLGRLRSGHGAAHSVRNGPIFPTSAIMLRRDAIPDFNPLGLAGYEDWNLWSDCLADGGAYGYVPGVYSRYRRNPGGFVARTGRSLSTSITLLEGALAWLGWFEARYPVYHSDCRFRRATLLANYGRLLFEHGEVKPARAYLSAAAGHYGPAAWKPAGLLAIATLRPELARGIYAKANMMRLASRRVRSWIR
jgi:glycosyltransferase involved in cell wall biosynthesis